MPTALITGITGQDGSYLAELLLGKGYRVVGIVKTHAGEEPNNVGHLADQLEIMSGDVRDTASLVDAILQSAPDEVYNLAAQSNAHASFGMADLTADVVGSGATNLLNAVIGHAPGARFFQAGSSEVFGQAMESPQNERTEFRPRSPYGKAKAHAHAAVAAARADHKVFAVSGILFNHESPRRAPQFVTRKITMAVARIRQGLQSEVVLGDLDVTRDWGFAGDYVDAMWRMLQQPEPRDYVIGTGKSWTVRELCDMAFKCAGLDYREHVRVDEALVRPREPVPLVADARLARRELDWHPRTAFPEVVKMMVDADIARAGLAA